MLRLARRGCGLVANVRWVLVALVTILTASCARSEGGKEGPGGSDGGVGGASQTTGCVVKVSGPIEAECECVARATTYAQIAIPIGTPCAFQIAARVNINDTIVEGYAQTFSTSDDGSLWSYAAISVEHETDTWALSHFTGDSQRPAILKESGTFTLEITNSNAQLTRDWKLSGSLEARLDYLTSSDSERPEQPPLTIHATFE